MAGTARTDSFLLANATVMVGPMADLHKLQPDKHSLGLVKRFVVTADPTFVELTQGITNDVVMSVKNSHGLKASFEGYEFTSRNLAYAAGLDASGATFENASTILPLDAEVDSSDTTFVVNGDLDAEIDVGEFVYIQEADDKVHVVKASSVALNTGKTTIGIATGFSVPTGVTFAAGSKVAKANKVEIGGSVVQATLAAKVVGTLPKDGSPVVLLFPKIKITKGFSVSFDTENFSNLPFEFTPYAGVPGDPFYSTYGTKVMIGLSGK
ncbi:hypothetical protein IZ6_25150 [Terrihabitans soli]|uniref:Uncharacterized protein n=1 Tax=Terrihabitans soli TaxID=708113 RepID=A0A6S6QXL9_9HYPH|nr:hypothetical protein [Terrihabitans soli]BCJ91780.1 hypothetical protein IZ6_25150 [Terrihabitans soli]